MSRKSLNHILFSLGGMVILAGAFVFISPSHAGVGSGESIEPMEDIHSELVGSSSSNSFVTDAPYALPKNFTGNGSGPILLDMNGDGLTDIVYSYANSYNSTSYVLLNTGSGFQTVYSCYIDFSATPDTYQGTCADL